MKIFHCLVISTLFVLLFRAGFAQTNISGGDVSGTWTKANSPYLINGEITIPNDSTLTIEPGVSVIFKGHYKFNVQGSLVAIGTQQDSIRFTAENTAAGWHGVRFTDTPNTNDTSRIIYCSFKYGKANTGSGFDKSGGAIFIKEFDKVLVSTCLFDSNMNSGGSLTPPQAGPAIFIYYASPLIKNSTFSNHIGALGSAIACVGSPNAIISNNILFNNRGLAAPVVAYGGGTPIITANIVFNNIGTYGAGINSENGAHARIENNIIFHNQAQTGAGIFCWSNVKAILINNTIAYNISSGSGGGIGLYANADPVLINNIIYANSATAGKQIYIDDNSSDPNFLNCDIQGGISGFAGSGAGSNYTGIYENNIDQDPLFKNTSSDDYSLSDSSFCIGAGVDSIEVENVWYKAPLFCMNGNPRPSPFGSIPDIGAYESLLGTPVTVVGQELMKPNEFALYQNYPNPFNPSTKISWQSPTGSWQTLKVYDVLGNEVATLVNEEKPAGNYEVLFNRSDLASGIYFYRLQARDFIQTKKMILMK